VSVGWKVVPVALGEAALQALEHEGPFDAVLLDVMMPGMDGPATRQQLRTHGLPVAVPVIFLTAKVQGSECQRLMSLGAAGVIAKPFDPLKLPDELARFLEEKLRATKVIQPIQERLRNLPIARIAPIKWYSGRVEESRDVELRSEV
jgi:two-component system, OmpR family, response regulator